MRILNFVLVASLLSTMLIAIALASAVLTSVVHGQFAAGSIRPSIVQNGLVMVAPAARRCFDRLVGRLWGVDADLFLIDQAVISAVAWSQTQAEPREAS